MQQRVLTPQPVPVHAVPGPDFTQGQDAFGLLHAHVHPPSLPELFRAWECLDGAGGFGKRIPFNDLMAVGGVGKGQAQIAGVLDGLLQAADRGFVLGFRLHHGDGEALGVAQQIIHPFGLLPFRPFPAQHHFACGVGPIRAIVMLSRHLAARPPRPVQCRIDQHRSGVRLSHAHDAWQPFGWMVNKTFMMPAIIPIPRA